MRRNKRNGKPDEGLCDTPHTVHSDELFVIRQHKRNGQPDQGVSQLHVFKGWSPVHVLTLLQDAANATLQSETLRETVCDAIIANGAV